MKKREAAECAVRIVDAQFADESRRLAAAVGLPLVRDAGEQFAYFLEYRDDGLTLVASGDEKQQTLRVDFVAGPTGYRLKQARGELLFDAIGVRKGVRTVVDATAGFLRDALLLAIRGCAVYAIERSPIVYALSRDALHRAAETPHLADALNRLQFVNDNAIDVLRNWTAPPPDAVYLDPMYPHRDSSALVKKEMRLIRGLVGDDPDAAELLAIARDRATDRVVVKRMIDAPPLGPDPTYCLKEKSVRFDIYKRF